MLNNESKFNYSKARNIKGFQERNKLYPIKLVVHEHCMHILKVNRSFAYPASQRNVLAYGHNSDDT